MVKSQKIVKTKTKPGPIIVDDRPPPEPTLPQKAINPETANAPVRTINFVEVGDMVGKQLQLILQRLNETHDTAKGGIHYFLPIRHGKIGSDIVFEEEFERVGRELFEVVNQEGKPIEGTQIRLKGGAKDVVVIRQKL
jgi:hypothetical protein